MHSISSNVVIEFTYYVGVVGCSVTACVEKCSCCTSMKFKYYDGTWMRPREPHNNNADEETDVSSEECCSSEEEPDEVRRGCC